MWLLLLPVLAHVVFAAHCYFHGLHALVALPAMLATALWIRHRSIPWIELVALAAFAAEWLRTAWVLVEIRRLHGMPYATALAILTTVALLTAASALVPFAKRLRAWYAN